MKTLVCAIIIILLIIVLMWKKAESFSPYESTLVYDMYRSDPSGDVPSANPAGRNNESILFNQLLGWTARV